MTDDSDQPTWQVVAEPVGANPGFKPKTAKGATKGRKRTTAADAEEKQKDNIGGVVLYLQRGTRREEFSRVGWLRPASENPKATFEEKFAEQRDNAQYVADELNKLQPDGELL